VIESILAVLAGIGVFFLNRTDTALELLALRQQVAVLKRKRPRPTLNSGDRLFWTTLRQFWSGWRDVLVIVKPETVIGWHRAGFRLYWRWRSRPGRGRPRTPEEIRVLIRRLAEENPGWGAPKIHGELQKPASWCRNGQLPGIFADCSAGVTQRNGGLLSYEITAR
jgi:hypothetical protein